MNGATALLRTVRRLTHIHIHRAASTSRSGVYLISRCRCGHHRIIWTRLGRYIWTSTWAAAHEATLQLHAAADTRLPEEEGR